MQDTKYRIILFSLIIVLIIAAVGSLFVGRYSLSYNEILGIIFHKETYNAAKYSILFNLRLPRIVATILAGGGLAVAGATYQAVLKNSLASPDVLGTSSASGFGAALGILLHQTFLVSSIMSFGFGLLSIGLVFGVCYFKKSKDELSIILSGIIVTSLFLAFTSLIKYVADPEDTLPAITFWLMGSFSSLVKTQVYSLIVLYVVCFYVLYKLRWKMNILSLGDEEALLSGVNPKILKIVLLCTSSVLVSSSVTIAGVIGWVGLAIPHLVRSIMGYNHGKLIPTSIVLGGLFVLIVDNIARTASYAEIPIGILTSFIGAPLFAILFIRGGKHDNG